MQLRAIHKTQEFEKSSRSQADPSDHDHDVDSLALSTIPLVAPRAILLIVPEGRTRGVHASLSQVVAGQGVLDDGGVDDELVWRRTGAGRRLFNQFLEDGGLPRSVSSFSIFKGEVNIR